MTFDDLRHYLHDYMRNSFRAPTVVRVTRDELMSLRCEAEAPRFFGVLTSACDPETVMGLEIEIVDSVSERFTT